MLCCLKDGRGKSIKEADGGGRKGGDVLARSAAEIRPELKAL